MIKNLLLFTIHRWRVLLTVTSTVLVTVSRRGVLLAVPGTGLGVLLSIPATVLVSVHLVARLLAAGRLHVCDLRAASRVVPAIGCRSRRSLLHWILVVSFNQKDHGYFLRRFENIAAPSKRSMVFSASSLFISGPLKAIFSRLVGFGFTLAELFTLVLI